MALFIKPEEEAWVVAACKVLSEKKTPLHHTQITQHLREAALIHPSIKSSLATALSKEGQRDSARILPVPGQAGMYSLAPRVSVPRPTTHASTSSLSSTVAHNGVVKRDKHYGKYIRLKRLVKNMVFLNAAICDEVGRLEEKVIRVRDERRFLVRHLIQQQAMADPSILPASPSLPSSSSQSASQSASDPEKKKKKMTTPTPPNFPSQAADPSKMKKKASVKDTPAPQLEDKPRPKKGKIVKRFVTPIPLDNTGRPVFPIELGTLTIYCLGDIVSAPGYSSFSAIYPVGFCSTREFISIQSPKEQTMYTCKVYEGQKGPTFELSADDCLDHVISGSSPDLCHSRLLKAINVSLGEDTAIPIEVYGAEFFGLSHPTVQNLVQYCPGAKKCAAYKWQKFEIAKDGAQHVESQVTVNVELLKATRAYVDAVKNYDSKEMKGSGSLRNLLTL